MSHVFVCDSENYMEILFGNDFLGESLFGYIFFFGIIFAIMHFGMSGLQI